jgi:hypothetical protein
MKIAVNKCYGGFSLSMLGYKRYLELKGRQAFFYKQTEYIWSETKKNKYVKITDLNNNVLCFYCVDKDLGDETNELPNGHFVYLRDMEIRTDVDLIKTIEELGSEKASGSCAKLRIVEIPDGVDWEIDEYDGIESIHEKHRSW